MDPQISGIVLNLKEKLEMGNQDVRCTEDNVIFDENIISNLYYEEGHEYYSLVH
jgi:hypothetical protein